MSADPMGRCDHWLERRQLASWNALTPRSGGDNLAQHGGRAGVLGRMSCMSPSRAGDGPMSCARHHGFGSPIHLREVHVPHLHAQPYALRSQHQRTPAAGCPRFAILRLTWDAKHRVACESRFIPTEGLRDCKPCPGAEPGLWPRGGPLLPPLQGSHPIKRICLPHLERPGFLVASHFVGLRDHWHIQEPTENRSLVHLGLRAQIGTHWLP